MEHQVKRSSDQDYPASSPAMLEDIGVISESQQGQFRGVAHNLCVTGLMVATLLILQPATPSASMLSPADIGPELDGRLFYHAAHAQVAVAGNVIETSSIRTPEAGHLHQARIRITSLLKGKFPSSTISVFSRRVHFEEGESDVYFIDQDDARAIGTNFQRILLPEKKRIYFIGGNGGRLDLGGQAEVGTERADFYIRLSGLVHTNPNLRKAVVKQLHTQLSNKNADVRTWAARALALTSGMADNASLKALISDAEVPSDVKFFLMAGIKPDESAHTLDWLFDLAKDTENPLSRPAATALGRIGSKKAISLLLEYTKLPGLPISNDLEVTNPEAIPILIDHLREEPHSLALLFLAQIGDRKAAPYLRRLLNREKTLFHQVAIAKALYWCGDLYGKQFLLRALKQKTDVTSQLRIGRSLAYLNAHDARGVLSGVAKSGNRRSETQAKRLLLRLDGREKIREFVARQNQE